MKQRDATSHFLKKIRRTIDEYRMVESGDTVIVAVSGGMDSMALLDCLWMLTDDLAISLVVAHLDHGLRGEESRETYRFVRRKAAEYGLPFEGHVLSKEDFPKNASIQNDARILRYRFLEDTKRRRHAQKVGLAHHKDDSIETIVMNFLRGTGMTGLKGIPPVRRGGYIRPFIETSRLEIEEFCRERNLDYREDSSNLKTLYLRNRIRHVLFPFLRDTILLSKDFNPVMNTAVILGSEDAYLDMTASRSLQTVAVEIQEGDKVIARRSMLKDLHPAIRRRVLRLAYEKVMGTTYGLSYAHINALNKGVLNDVPHRQYCLPGGIHVYFEYDTITFTRKNLWETIAFDYVHSLGGRTLIHESGIWLCSRVIGTEVPEAATNCLSDQAIIALVHPVREVRVRNCRPGDRFRPFGMGHTKKLKDFFMDQRVPRSVRLRVPVVEIEGDIAWVVGYRIDERFKIAPKACVEYAHLWAETVHGRGPHA